ncbi:unnamed protein product [Ranitomeya imitator]|uniref:Uncharacterized protein n=1 Tax=Ranitomeya imitator TaxID=111125 RepID=A0ABN9MQP8_9NEOB|nr:unnamed protein product [Ranitomeya imitator]
MVGNGDSITISGWIQSEPRAEIPAPPVSAAVTEISNGCQRQVVLLITQLIRTQHPIDFPSWCEARYDALTCQISVVQKANPKLPCVHSADYEWGSAGAPEPSTSASYPTHLGS